MIIFVGGLPGAGKSSVSRRLADKLGFYYYDIDEIKKEVYQQDPDFEHNMAHGIPFKDETRQKVFERVVEDFKYMRDSYEHMVVDETLHKRELRHVLFDGAKKYFKNYFIIWVEVDEAIVAQRFASKVREGHILKDPMKMHLGFKREFEPFQKSSIHCLNNTSLDKTVDDLVGLFQQVRQLSV